MKKINSGIIVIYKEEGVTSRDAVNIVSKKLNVKAKRFTKKAAEAIVAAGGKIEVI